MTFKNTMVLEMEHGVFKWHAVSGGKSVVTPVVTLPWEVIQFQLFFDKEHVIGLPHKPDQNLKVLVETLQSAI